MLQLGLTLSKIASTPLRSGREGVDQFLSWVAGPEGPLLSPHCWRWPDEFCSPAGGASIGIVGAGVGVVLGIIAAVQAYLYQKAGKRGIDELDKATGNLAATANSIATKVNELDEATDNLTVTAGNIVRKAEEIADHLNHKIFSVGEAIAYAYYVLQQVNQACERMKRGEKITIEVYYINIVCCFGAVHEVNQTVVDHYDEQQKKLDLKLDFTQLIQVFPEALRQLTEKCTTKVTLLEPTHLDEKFFDVLREKEPYNLEVHKPTLKDAIKREKDLRRTLKKANTNYAVSVPFQMLTSRVVREDDTVESARSLVLAVGTTSIGKGLGQDETEEMKKGQDRPTAMANGYYTKDPHYAEIDVQIAKSIWEEAQNRKSPPAGEAAVRG